MSDIIDNAQWLRRRESIINDRGGAKEEEVLLMGAMLKRFYFLENYLEGKFVTLFQKAANINQTMYNI